MPEWPNGAVSKTVVRVTVPRVRIPVFPQKTQKIPQLKKLSHPVLHPKNVTLGDFIIYAGDKILIYRLLA